MFIVGCCHKVIVPLHGYNPECCVSVSIVAVASEMGALCQSPPSQCFPVGDTPVI